MLDPKFAKIVWVDEHTSHFMVGDEVGAVATVSGTVITITCNPGYTIENPDFRCTLLHRVVEEAPALRGDLAEDEERSGGTGA